MRITNQKGLPWEVRVARGELGWKYVNKFGHNPEIDTGTTPEDIWSGGGIYTFTADGGAPYFISSSSAADTQVMTLQCLTEDASGDWNTENITVTLTGQTKVAINFPSGDDPVRFYRGYNTGSVDLAGTVYIYEDDTLTDGVPDTATKIRGAITPGDNQTEMAIYTIPSGYKGFFMKGWLSLASSVRDLDAVIRYAIRLHGGVFRGQGRVSLDTQGTMSWMYSYEAGKPVLPAKTDIVMTVVSVSANGASVSGGFDILLERIDT